MLHTAEMDFILFGDQTAEKLPAIRQLVGHASGSRLVQRFLREACDGLQLEISQLPAHSEQRCSIGGFDSILRLAEDNARLEEPNEIVATVLMNIARLGEFILYAEEDPTVLASNGNRSRILGFCTGEVPAAVAAVARDTNELVDLAVEATRITFRLARELSYWTWMVDRDNAPWARTVIGISAERVRDIMQEFHESQSIPRVRRACIGFLSDSWLTISGPPKTLERLFAWSEELGETPNMAIDVFGVAHMETFPAVDLDRILGPSPWLDRVPLPGATIVSPYTCQPRQQETLRGLLEEIILDVGQKTLQLTASMSAALENIQARRLRAIIPGYTSHDVSLIKTLQKLGIEYSVMSHCSSPTSNSGRQGSGLVAIVGMSGKFPGSGDVNAFWEHLLQGKRYVQEIPNTRFAMEQWYDETLQPKTSTLARTGAFLDKPGLFDYRLFNMSPREAMQTDVQHRLLMTSSYEALEMAGYSPDGTLSTSRERIASYIGQTTDDWREMVAHQGADIYFATGNCRAFGPGRMNHHYKWGGPSYSIDSACSSSIAAISLACSGLLSRDCDMAVAGGGSILVSPAIFSGLSRAGFLSRDGGCQTFQDDADGYVRGEGVGVVVLKRLEDALDDDDNILGVVRGSGRNYSSDASSMVHPSENSQRQLYRNVLEKSGVDPLSISYVEMHGTGTQAGDFAEMSSVLSTFAENRGRDNPLTVGSVKASIGHGEAAAGVCALIKTLMMLQSRQIPPQPEFPGPRNNRFPDLEALNVRIAGPNMRLEPSPEADGAIRVFLNSFDASGGNSCLLLEEAPKRAAKDADPRRHHVMTLSARSHKSLVGVKERYLAHLRQHPSIQLADLAFTTTARRMHGSLRHAIAASSTAQVIQSLEADLAQGMTPRQPPATPSIVFVFTGQGAHYLGMGSQLWQTSATFRNRLEDYQTLATALDLPYFLDLIKDSNSQKPEPDTVQVQLAMLTLELALVELWRSWGLKPAMVLGHSLGEYAALCVAEVLTVSDALYLVGKRAQIIAGTLTPHEYGMLAINLGTNGVRQALADGRHTLCVPACINSPKMTVVSGPRVALEKLQSQLKSDGTRCTYLSAPYGFHSPQLDPILAQFEAACQCVAFSKPKIPVVSTLLATAVHGEGTFSPAYLARQAREPVNFVGALTALQEEKVSNTVFVEIGPDPVCSGLVGSTLRTDEGQPSCFASMHRERDNWASISSTMRDLYMAGASFDWPAYHREFKSSVSLIDLPKYAFDEKEFWTPFPEPEPKSNGGGHVSPAQAQYTTTLQQILEEKVQPDQVSVKFASSLADHDLRAAVRGHAVADSEICPSSLLLDMALSAADYAYRKHTPGQAMTVPLTIRNCHFHRALVLGDQAQTVEVTVTLWFSTKVADIQYHCRTPEDYYEIGYCQVSLEPAGEPAQAGFLVRSRMAALKASAGHQLGKQAVYRLFEDVVRYSAQYQGLEKVHLSEDMQDALAQINMANVPTAGGHYLYHPFLLDSIAHLSGFLLNNGLRYPSELACLATGFKEWHMLKPLSPNTVYTSYTFMEDSASTSSLVTGEIYVFDEEELISVLTGVQFQKMKKAALTHILGPLKAHNMATTASKPDADMELSSPNPSKMVTSTIERKEIDQDVSVPLVTASDNDGEEKQDGLVDRLFSIVAREVGVDPSDLQGEINLAGLGIDSLMAVSIISVMHKETGVELPGTFFLEHSTTAQARAAIASRR